MNNQIFGTTPGEIKKTFGVYNPEFTGPTASVVKTIADNVQSMALAIAGSDLPESYKQHSLNLLFAAQVGTIGSFAYGWNGNGGQA